MKWMVLTFCLFTSNLCFCQNSGKDRVRLKSDGIIDVYYQYDEQGRLSQKRNSNWSYYEKFGYRKDTVLVYAVQMTDSSLYQMYVLNKDELADQSCLILGKEYFCEYYLYKNLLAEKSYHHYPVDGKSSTYDTKEGNQTIEYFSDTSFQANTLMHQQSVFDYSFSTQINTLTNEVFGQSYLGKSNKNLISKTAVSSANSGVCDKLPCLVKPETMEKYDIGYEYIFDEKGRITEEIKTYISNQKKIKTKYYYY